MYFFFFIIGILKVMSLFFIFIVLFWVIWEVNFFFFKLIVFILIWIRNLIFFDVNNLIVCFVGKRIEIVVLIGEISFLLFGLIIIFFFIIFCEKIGLLVWFSGLVKFDKGFIILSFVFDMIVFFFVDFVFVVEVMIVLGINFFFLVFVKIFDFLKNSVKNKGIKIVIVI